MRVTDGRYNRADLNGISLKEGHEVYDLSIFYFIFSNQLGQ